MTTNRFIRCCIDGCDEPVYQDTRYCLNHLTENWDDDYDDESVAASIREAADIDSVMQQEVDDPIMPCGHRQSAVYRDPEPLGGTSHCMKCAAKVYKNVYVGDFGNGEGQALMGDDPEVTNVSFGWSSVYCDWPCFGLFLIWMMPRLWWKPVLVVHLFIIHFQIGWLADSPNALLYGENDN